MPAGRPSPDRDSLDRSHAGLILGVRDSLAPGEADAFKAAGCSHILALSGEHLSVFALLSIAALSPYWGRSRAAGRRDPRKRLYVDRRPRAVPLAGGADGLDRGDRGRPGQASSLARLVGPRLSPDGPARSFRRSESRLHPFLPRRLGPCSIWAPVSPSCSGGRSRPSSASRPPPHYRLKRPFRPSWLSVSDTCNSPGYPPPWRRGPSSWRSCGGAWAWAWSAPASLPRRTWRCRYPISCIAPHGNHGAAAPPYPASSYARARAVRAPS